MPWIILVLISLSLQHSAVASADAATKISKPSLFRAVYKADYKGLPISAKGIRELSITDEGHYHLSSIATSMFASIKESTRFTIDGSQIVPLEYQYHRSGIGKKREAILDFDWENNSVLNNVQNKPWRMDVPTGALDKLLYQYKLRNDLMAAYANGTDWPELSYVIADGGKLKHYHFEVIGEEEIDTPIGKLKTIKAARVKDERNRESTFWLAPEYDFLLVRFQQLEADGDGFELLLREATFNGEEL